MAVWAESIFSPHSTEKLENEDFMEVRKFEALRTSQAPMKLE